MKIIVAQLGARMHYAVPRIMQSAGMLSRFYTDICASQGWPRLLNRLPSACLPGGLARLTNRVPEGVEPKLITSFPVLGLQYARARKNNPSLTVHIDFGKRFCKRIVEQGWHGADTVYAFNSAALELFDAAKKAGLRTVLEQTIAPRRIERQILAEAAERYPGWGKGYANTLEIDAFADREEAEWQLADLILCGSEFVRDGIAARGGPVERCIVVPYGVDMRQFAIPSRTRQSGPLRVLTVGAVGLRKGSPVVLEAAKRLKGICQFRMVGGFTADSSVRKQLSEHVELTGVVPRSQILEHFACADVFLLPSLCEGSATVTYEAMAAGLPVVCTPNTGSIVEDGKEGLLAPIFDISTTVDFLNHLAGDVDLLQRTAEFARFKSAVGSLQSYQQRLIKALEMPSL